MVPPGGLTHEGFNLAAPRYGSDGTVYYATNDPHRFPALKRLPPDGRPRDAHDARARRAHLRARHWIVFDQLETVRSTALYSDLYAVKHRGGRTRRLTVEARASDPDLSPDGRRIVCVVQKVGYRAVAVLDFRPDRRTTPTVIVDQPDSGLHRAAMVARRTPGGRVPPATRPLRSGRHRRRDASDAIACRAPGCSIDYAVVDT